MKLISKPHIQTRHVDWIEQIKKLHIQSKLTKNRSFVLRKKSRREGEEIAMWKREKFLLLGLINFRCSPRQIASLPCTQDFNRETPRLGQMGYYSSNSVKFMTLYTNFLTPWEKPENRKSLWVLGQFAFRLKVVKKLVINRQYFALIMSKFIKYTPSVPEKLAHFPF